METATQIPSGPWSGFYLESHQPRRGWMHLYLTFQEGQILGEGTDYVGPWTIQGAYNLTSWRAEWIKQYVGKHQVEYEGSITADGILGQWNIRSWSRGDFHIWPGDRVDLQNRYLTDELENNPPTTLLGTIPIPPNDRV